MCKRCAIIWKHRSSTATSALNRDAITADITYPIVARMHGAAQYRNTSVFVPPMTAIHKQIEVNVGNSGLSRQNRIVTLGNAPITASIGPNARNTADTICKVDLFASQYIAASVNVYELVGVTETCVTEMTSIPTSRPSAPTKTGWFLFVDCRIIPPVIRSVRGTMTMVSLTNVPNTITPIK